ncbi:hypothetical protein, partial [Aliarcobacter cryaerophilus]|uniref:hypothetical protein n=1 Tax=Aliarcobacter cryaerophilus TaxID=28198 RepID=UPI001CA30209
PFNEYFAILAVPVLTDRSTSLFHTRIETGVTSTASSSSIHSKAFSKDIVLGGITLIASSAPEDLTYDCCFP